MLIDLQTWIDRTYAAKPPARNTVRKWCREGKIFPQRTDKAFVGKAIATVADLQYRRRHAIGISADSS